MTLPEEIKIKIIDDSGKTVKGLIVELRISSGSKNDYSILSDKTRDDGQSIITKENFIGQFKDH